MDKNYLPGVAGYANDIVDYYKRIQEIIHEQAEFYRSQGYKDTSDEVSKLSDLWWDYAQKIKDVRDQVVDNLLDMVDKKKIGIAQGVDITEGTRYAP